MSTLTVTAKGQVTLRKDILAHLGVGPGDQISVEKLPDGRIEVRAPHCGDISAVFNLLKRTDGPTLTLDEISEAAASGWSDQD
jgi:AbrB family looped-hinge helix DNA binding protein